MKEILRKVRKFNLRINRLVNTTFAGEYRSAFRGQGLEFDEVRQYQIGDDIRSIDWNVSAKAGETFIKVFREEREQTVMVLFDISGSEDFGSGTTNKLQVGIEIAAVLAFSALKHNDKIGLSLFSENTEAFIRPAKGHRHVMGMVKKLLTHEPKALGTNLKDALEFVRRILRRKSIVIVISDFISEGYERPLRMLASHHDLILMRLFHPQEVIQDGAGIIPVVDAESRQIMWLNMSNKRYRNRLESNFNAIADRLHAFASRQHCSLVTIDTSQDFIPQLEKFFNTRNARW